MEAVVLGAAFLALLVFFLRFPARPLAIAVSAVAGIVALAQLALSYLPTVTGNGPHPERAVASLVVTSLLFSAAVASPREQQPRKLPRKRKKPKTRHETKVQGGKQSDTVESDLSAYERQDRVGIGGMASVYRARRRSDGRTVALKIPQERFVVDPKFVRRFHREAEVLMRLDHPNIIKVFEHGSEGLTHFIAMEFVQGEALEDLVDTHRISLRQGVQVMRCVVDALAYIHRQGIVHRDIKPGNIMVLDGALGEFPSSRIEPSGVKLMDFGIAAGKVLTRLTATGARVGTPVYMSPEQAKGLRIDHRSDVYSLGLVFYETVTGQSAFKGTSEAVVHQQISQMPPPPRQVNHEVPQALSALIMRMILKEPERRATLSEVMEVLDGDLFGERAPGEAARMVVSANSRRGFVRFLDRSGELLASLGQADGEDGGAFAAAPTALAAFANGDVLAPAPIAGMLGAQRLLRVTPGGESSTFAELPYGITIDYLAIGPHGEVFALDREAHLVHRFSPQGERLGAFGGRGEGRGLFQQPTTLVAGGVGHLYVLDFGNRQVQRFTLDGHYQNRYSIRLRNEGSELRLLDGVGVDRNGTVFIGDASSGKIRAIRLDGTQGPSLDVPAQAGEDERESLLIAVDDDDNLFAVRRGGHVIHRYDRQGMPAGTIDAYAQVLAFALPAQAGQTAAVPLPAA